MVRKASAINEIDQYIAQRIRLRRIMLGMSQSDLANSCKISFQQIQKYETAACRITATRLFDISRALDTTVAFFFSGLPGNLSSESGPFQSMRVSDVNENDPLGKNDSLQLINLYWNLPSDEHRDMIMKMLRSLNGESINKKAK